jgi:hypothetical protein
MKIPRLLQLDSLSVVRICSAVAFIMIWLEFLKLSQQP